jgi:outer membrane protein assembly factor BamB
MQHIARQVFLLFLVFNLAACSTISGWFESDEDEATAPAELNDIEEKVSIEELWSVNVGNGQGEGFYRIRPAINGAMIYVAAADGEVVAVERASGDTVWEVELEASLSGGVGVYEEALFVGSSEGFVLKLDASSGEQLWSSPLRGEILSAPQSNGKVVVTQTYDGRLHGLDFETGAMLWTYDSNLPVLTVRGTSTPIFNNNQVYAAFANGRVLAFDAQTGGLLWEVRVAIPQGRSEIERIVDIDGSMELAGNELFAVSYQGFVAAIDLQSGRKLWQQKGSSFSGVSQGFSNIYVADEDGTITAYMRNGQGVRWTQGALAYRELSRPTPVSSYIAVGDFEGYVHLLSQVDGEFVGRVRADDEGVRADMIGDGNVLYVFGNSGELIAYEITSKDG